MEEIIYNNPNEVVVFTIGDTKVEMNKLEYDNYIRIGLCNPVLIGNTIYMVSDDDYNAIQKIEKKMKDMGLNELPPTIKPVE